MRTPGSPEVLEERRRIVVRMLQDGVSPTDVARRLHVARSSVYRWMDAYSARGLPGLAPVPHPGPRPKLTSKQHKKLHKLLLKGALAAGYSTNLWTRQRVAELIEREFGVHYHTDHISRVLTGLGWSCQKPERQARERDDARVQSWIHRDWPRIKKRPVAPAR